MLLYLVESYAPSTSPSVIDSFSVVDNGVDNSLQDSMLTRSNMLIAYHSYVRTAHPWNDAPLCQESSGDLPNL